MTHAFWLLRPMSSKQKIIDQDDGYVNQKGDSCEFGVSRRRSTEQHAVTEREAPDQPVKAHIYQLLLGQNACHLF